MIFTAQRNLKMLFKSACTLFMLSAAISWAASPKDDENRWYRSNYSCQNYELTIHSYCSFIDDDPHAFCGQQFIHIVDENKKEKKLYVQKIRILTIKASNFCYYSLIFF